MKKLEERREKKQAEVDRCADLRGMLYEDMKDGIISKEDYKELPDFRLHQDIPCSNHQNQILLRCGSYQIPLFHGLMIQ